MIVTVSLVNPEAQASHNRLKKQEQCERLCLACLDLGEGEGSLCVSLSKYCCVRNGGHPHGTCGCRIEM